MRTTPTRAQRPVAALLALLAVTIAACSDSATGPDPNPVVGVNEDWTAFSGGVLVLEVTGDGRDDMVWNERAATNRIYVAVAQPSGS